MWSKALCVQQFPYIVEHSFPLLSQAHWSDLYNAIRIDRRTRRSHMALSDSHSDCGRKGRLGWKQLDRA
jgi:hypothetical protein